MSSAWTPVKGMLCEAPDGRWFQLSRVFESPAHGYKCSAEWQSGGWYGSSLKPLAPAPTPGGLWDALKGIPGACFADGFPAAKLTPMDIHSEVLILPLEDCQLLFWQAAPGFPIRCQFNPNTEETEMSEQESYEARGRDWQKEGAIRAYAAQPGWGGGE